MKKWIYFIVLIGFANSTFAQNILSVDNSRFSSAHSNLLQGQSNTFTSNIKSLVFVEKSYTFEDWKYETELLQSLDDYTLKANSLHDTSNGVIQIDFENLEKQFFDNYDGGFNNDLSKYIQRAPDIMWLCPIY